MFVAAVWLPFLFGCGSATVPPILLESGELEYPAEQREAKVQGYVIVAYDVTETGTVMNVRIVEAQPSDVFDEEAVAYVKSWTFQPRKREGVPEAVQNMQSRITFVLDEGDASYKEFIK